MGVRETVEHLAAMHTRHTLSDGCFEAAEWITEQYRAIPRMQVEVMEYELPVGPRVPTPKVVPQVIAWLPGRTSRRVMISGHFDSLNLVGTDGPGDFDRVISNRAPGANDDASGIAAALESARILADQQYENTLVFCAFSGEEQGLLGSKALAERAVDENWHIDAMIALDMVGSSRNLRGEQNRHQVRLFSTDHSRELAIWMEWLVRRAEIAAPNGEDFTLRLIYRGDRFGRGGDHTPFDLKGFRAVRQTEVHEEYAHQHTLEDTPENMDFPFLESAAHANAAALLGLAQASLPPTEVWIARDQNPDTTICWTPSADAVHKVLWRETTSPMWQGEVPETKPGQTIVVGVNKDDHLFGVSASGSVPKIVEIMR